MKSRPFTSRSPNALAVSDISEFLTPIQNKETASKEKQETEEEESSSRNSSSNYVTPFGAVRILTVAGMIAQMWAVITSFFTDAVNEAILSEYSGEEVLGIMLLVVFLWFMISPVIQKFVMWFFVEGMGWNMMWVMLIQYLSKIILLVAFGYAAILLKQMWVRAGLLLVELLFITIVLALYAFGAYAYFIARQQIQEKIKQQEQQ